MHKRPIDRYLQLRCRLQPSCYLTWISLPAFAMSLRQAMSTASRFLARARRETSTCLRSAEFIFRASVHPSARRATSFPSAITCQPFNYCRPGKINGEKGVLCSGQRFSNPRARGFRRPCPRLCVTIYTLNVLESRAVASTNTTGD